MQQADKKIKETNKRGGGYCGPKMRKSLFTKNTLPMLAKMFGKDAVTQTVDVRKFAVNPNSLETPETENKETFNGTRYENIAPGDKRVVTEEGVAKQTGWGRTVGIKKMDDVKRIVIGEVYVPYDPSNPATVDSHGHACTAASIEKAAYDFMRNLCNSNVDVQHNFTSGYGCVVESYIAKAGDPMFVPGSWVIGVHVTDDSIWSKIQKGEITGFSLAGSANLVKPDQVTSSFNVDHGREYRA